MRYDKLHAFDATGREIEARMKLAGDQVRIEVADEGAIYPVTIDPTFTQQQKLEASDAAAGDLFGASVAISGETVVVGASVDDGARAPIKARPMSLCAAVESGASSRSSRPRTRRQVTSSAPRWRSAGRRSWSARQVMMARRAPIKARPMSLCAAAESGASSRSWRPRTRRQLTTFGDSVAISGETVVVGASFDDGAAGFDQGSAYVFVRSGGVWSQQQKLEASDAAAGDFFGYLGGDQRGDGRGRRVEDDGAAGVDQGSAYVFVRSGGVWSQQQKLEASDAAAGDQFGDSVAISGETVVVGAPFG